MFHKVKKRDKKVDTKNTIYERPNEGEKTNHKYQNYKISKLYNQIINTKRDKKGTLPMCAEVYMSEVEPDKYNK